jgi:hypothetical protein
MLQRVVVLLAIAAVVACGDPGHTTERGYVKPPLETPGLVVRGEDVSEMSELGEPVRPRPKQPSEVVPRDDGG